MAEVAISKPIVEVESDEDKELQNELIFLVERIKDKDAKLVGSALEMLKHIIRTSTTSMTSVPKPLKYLAPYYLELKNIHKNMPDGPNKKHLSNIISVLALGTAGGDVARKENDCLTYCLTGTMTDIGEWGHEYIRQLESEIVATWDTEKTTDILMPLVRDIIKFDCNHHGEIQGCDFLMELGLLHILKEYITADTYERICLYLTTCTKYVDPIEADRIMLFVAEQYINFKAYTKALILFLQSHQNYEMVKHVFNMCTHKPVLYQMAFICGRHVYPVEIELGDELGDELMNIVGNNHLSSNFLNFARELDIMEPKTPEDVYKTWLEPTTHLSFLGENLDSARQNLASSFVNGLVNAGFGTDKLLTTEDGNKWIYRNKDHGMVSATASLGMLYLWDVDGGLTPIDKYLYSTDDNIKAGALLALGIVNCRVRNECDPALALLSDYVVNSNPIYQTGAIFGIGLAYVGTARDDVLDLLAPIVQDSESPEIFGIACLACGLVALGRSKHYVITSILSKLIESNNTPQLRSPYMRLAGLGFALCNIGCKDLTDVCYTALEVFEPPFRLIMQNMLQMCAYAGTGDVLIVQDLLRNVEETARRLDNKRKDKKDKRKYRKGPEWNSSMGQAVGVLAVAAVSKGEEIGAEMVQRIFSHIARYGEPTVRKAVPLAVALTSVSNPHLSVIDILTKYSHDSDDEVACNAIFGLGFVGAGTNNARLAAGLRQMAVYHARNPSQLFMVRLSQGLLHLGKGTMTLSPLHTDRQLLDPAAMAGLMIPLVALLDPHSLILGKAHFLLYSLVAAIQPRWLLTLGEDLEPINVTVRVGQAVDIIGKAGTPKTIAGIHTHTTPVLLASGERAELVGDQNIVHSPTLDGICVLSQT